MRRVTFLIALFCCASSHGDTTDLLVAMNGTGRIERYDNNGKHVGTFARGLVKPNGMTFGPDEKLYVACGAINSHGSVVRIDGTTGKWIGPFIDIPAGMPGTIARATSIAFAGDEALVVSCDSGEVLRYDAKTGAYRGVLGTGSKGGLTQALAIDNRLYVADWHAMAVRGFNLAKPTNDVLLVRGEGFHPWGIAFDFGGRLYWSGDTNQIRRFDEKMDAVLASGDGLSTPVQLALATDGSLYASNLGSNRVTVLDSRDGKLLRTIEGPEMIRPIGLAFTTSPRREQKPPITLASSITDGSAALITAAPLLPDNARPAVRIVADAEFPELPFLGIDTERGDRVKHNLLRAPIRLVLRSRDGKSIDAIHQICTAEIDERSARYSIQLPGGAKLVWEITTSAGQWVMRISDRGLEQFDGVDIVFPLDPKTCSTSIVTGQWSKAGRFSLPAILSAPDLGQFHVTSDGGGTIEGSFVGERPGWMDLTFHLPTPNDRGITVNFAPLVLPAPAGIDAELWRQARRGWFNLFQLSAQWRHPHGGPAAPAGVLANNVLSDPVSSLLWFHGDQALLLPDLAPGVRATDVLRHSIEYWLYNSIEPDGQVWYVAAAKHQMMDANPAILIAAWCYVEATGDVAWAKQHLPRLELIADYLARCDIDNDGLCESVQSGNLGTKAFGDTSIDTISSGHKNAWVNALVYRVWRCLADIEKKSGHTDAAKRFDDLAAKLRAAYAPAFLNSETGMLYWWRGADGRAHDYASTLVATYAVEYGLLDEAGSKKLMAAMCKKLESAGYKRFDLGIPISLVPVVRDAQYQDFGGKKEDGSDTFQRYCNGGVFPQFAINAMTALWDVGQNDRADTMLRAMLERQDRGVFPNDGGFQTGITNVMGTGPEIYDWNGATTGYEGYCVRDCSFVMGVLLRDPAIRAKVYRPAR